MNFRNAHRIKQRFGNILIHVEHPLKISFDVIYAFLMNCEFRISGIDYE